MTLPVPLQKAELRQLDAEMRNEIKPEKNAKLQFNPETLKVTFANQIKTPEGAGDQSGGAARQFVGSGTTKLSLTVYFDATAPVPVGETPVDDVRRLTQKVAYFITPQPEGKQFIPPAVRFVWGSFQFDGLMDGLEENLEFFSNEGKPLRASMTFTLSQQRITEFTFKDVGGLPGMGGASSLMTPGTQPLAQAPAGATVQSIAEQVGRGDDWQSIASANGIENPRILNPGQLLDLNA